MVSKKRKLTIKRTFARPLICRSLKRGGSNHNIEKKIRMKKGSIGVQN